MKASEALARYGMLVGPEKKSQSLSYVRRWLQWGGQPTEARMRAYVKHLQGLQYKSSTIDLHLRIISAFYRANSIRPPQWRYRHDPSTERRPRASSRLVAAMIDAAKAGDLTASQTALLAVSTTYGARVGELATLTGELVDMEHDRIFILTEKEGDRRWQWIPPEVRPHLDIEWWPQSLKAAAGAFDSILSAVGVPRKPKDGYGWHMIRRALLGDMELAGIPRDDARHFVRWASKVSKAEGAGEHGRYLDPSVFVDLDGETNARPVLTEEQQDALVWQRHPYVAMWS